jgi:hypothetical protein
MAANNPDIYTPDMIAAVVLALENSAARLRAVGELMTELKINELPIKNSKDLKSKGLPKVAAFSQAAEDAMRDHRLGVK